jgi:hypothetical protein
MTETFVAIVAMMIAMLACVGIAIGVAAAFAAWRVCRRDWGPQAIESNPKPRLKG